MMATPGKSSEAAVKFLTSTTGRDKINRFVQYVCKFLIGYGGTRLSKESLGKLSALMVQATQTRKVMRLGRQLEFYKAAQKARLIQDDVLRYTGVVKNAGLGLWLVFDSLGWAHGAGLTKLSNVKDINRRGYQFWWISIVASLLSDLHRLRMNGIRRQLEQKTLVASNKNKVFQDASVAQQSLTQLEKERQAIVFATVQDALDLVIPSTLLEYITMDAGVIGLIGAITSVMGGVTYWKSL